jgi:hypothetical protein
MQSHCGKFRKILPQSECSDFDINFEHFFAADGLLPKQSSSTLMSTLITVFLRMTAAKKSSSNDLEKFEFSKFLKRGSFCNIGVAAPRECVFLRQKHSGSSCWFMWQLKHLADFLAADSSLELKMSNDLENNFEKRAKIIFFVSCGNSKTLRIFLLQTAFWSSEMSNDLEHFFEKGPGSRSVH